MNNKDHKYVDPVIRLIIFLAVYFSVAFLGNSFEKEIISSAASFNNFLSKDLNSSGGINYKTVYFKHDEGNLRTEFAISSVKSRSQVRGGFIKSDFSIHYWMPFTLLLSLLLILPSKKKWKILLISLALYFFLAEFKIWIQVIDECYHDVVFKDGQIMSVLIDPGFKENLVAGLNKILNIKTAVYSRYLGVFLIILFTYLKIEKPKFKLPTGKISTAH